MSFTEINGRLSASDKWLKLFKDVGFPALVALILLWDRITVFQKFTEIMTEVSVTLRDVREQLPREGFHH